MSEIPIVISPDTQRPKRVPPGQRLTDKWPVLHFGPVHRLALDKWCLTIAGLVETKRVLTYPEFSAMPRVKVFCDIHCVTTWSRLDNWFEGVSTAEIRSLVSIQPEARFVVAHAAGGFTTNLSVEDFFQPDVLFAFKHNEQAISPDHGYPVRLVVPRLYFWKSAKWVTGIEFTARDQPGFWESNGYHNHGDPWTEERYG
jgi:DMSO/TMAO reductase YedYZ molybdopterin-dependent catalytic subunit